MDRGAWPATVHRVARLGNWAHTHVNAGDKHSILALGRFHILKNNSRPCTTTTECVLQSPQAIITKPARRNYWSPHTLGPESCSCWACVPSVLGSTARKATETRSLLSHCNEEWPLLAATRESPCKAMKTQHSPKTHTHTNCKWIRYEWNSKRRGVVGLLWKSGWISHSPNDFKNWTWLSVWITTKGNKT